MQLLEQHAYIHMKNTNLNEQHGRKQLKKDLLHRLEVQDRTRMSECRQVCPTKFRCCFCLRRNGKNEDTVRRNISEGRFSAGSAKHASLSPVELKVIPLAPDSLVEDRIIEAIAATKNDQVLKTFFVAAVLAHAWRDVAFWYFGFFRRLLSFAGLRFS